MAMCSPDRIPGRLFVVVSAAALLGMFVACTPETTRNPYLTLAETFGVTTNTNTNSSTGGGTGGEAQTQFRRDMTVTIQNRHPNAVLNTSLLAWVNPGSIRSADQQDALLRGGYVQLTRQTTIGSAFSLAPGTFVLNGTGAAGATAIRIEKAPDANTATSESITLITPDVLLIFSQPPVSCDSVAFYYTIDGDVIFEDDNNPSRRTFDEGGFKTLAQIDVYDCDPLSPGLFLKTGGGARRSNEYFEGESVTFSFSRFPDANDHFATVTIGGGNP